MTDQKKRELLGDVFNLIRFPNMDADEFIRSVSSAEVLTTEESLNLILLMKGSTPKKDLAFSSVERSGRWKEEFFKGLSIVSQSGFQFGSKAGMFVPPQQSDIYIPFQVNYAKEKAICIKSVFLINNTNCEFGRVSLSDSEGKISRLENRTYVGCQLYEAVFNPKVIIESSLTPPVIIENPSLHQPTMLQSSTTASIIVQHPCQSLYPNLQQQQPPGQATLLQGQRTIGANPDSQSFAGTAQVLDFKQRGKPKRLAHRNRPEELTSSLTNTTITMQNVPWHFVVGFKYKTM